MNKNPHPNTTVNLQKDTQVINYEKFSIHWGNHEQYCVICKIGRGRYSHVFLGMDIKNKHRIAIKVLLPISIEKIKRQYQIMKRMDHPNIIRIIDLVQCKHLKTVSFIIEHFQHQNFRQLYPLLSLPQIKCYIKQLLQALEYMHSIGIMHRDIKPYNVLINRNTKQLKVIDFGLSDYFLPEKDNSTKVASMYYKAPELCFGNTHYDYRVDIWAVGMILAGMIFKKVPFLMGNDHIDQILKICKLMGTGQVVKYIKEYKLTEKKSHKKDNICFDLLIAFENGDIKSDKPSSLEEFINPQNQSHVTWEALDLIRKLLVLNYKQRFTAKQALSHPFFGQN